MSTNPPNIKKGLKFVFGSIPFIILAPILMNIGFSAIKKDDNYIIITIAFVIAIIAIGFVMNGLDLF